MDDRIIDFLCRAKKATYAGKGAQTASSRPHSHDLQYTENNLLYIDTYLGGKQFAGEEALWRDGIPFWSMNYIGRVIGDGFSGDFLKECLLLVPEDAPYRGPAEHRSGDFTYLCTVEGELGWFHGYEEISLRETKIFECVFHGGFVE